MTEIRDKYGRTFKTLRISLLNRCNLGCVYCSNAEDPGKKHVREEIIPLSELLRQVEQLHQLLGFENVRLTGGEPLLYPDLIAVIEGLNRIGISKIKLTTNGFLLERMAVPMKQAGMQSLNVSLDAMDEDVFFLMSRRSNLPRILHGIEAAITAGLDVKINTVLMKGINESQLLPLLEYAFSRNIAIRFLEVMAMGHLHGNSGAYLVSQQQILDAIGEKFKFNPLPRSASSTANYWQTDQGNTFGIIANESEPFCHDCNRLRLDSLGNIYGCLSSNHPISLAGVYGPDEIKKKLQEALLQKQSLRFTGSELSMLHIGG